jgi:protein-S-isoprenylcysteine O-methyltransferase Ste14
MSVNTILLIILAIVYSAVEGLLLLRDRSNAKGSTKIDKMTRLFNFLSTEGALLSALFIMLSPFNFHDKSLFFPTIIGTILATLGFTLRHVSIHILGKYFRTTVEIDEDQPVIQTGPYRFVRHPSYSGIILFFIGYGVLSQNWLCLVACLLLPVAALSYRINVEEKALAYELGTKYEDYRMKTKKLIPFIW